MKQVVFPVFSSSSCVLLAGGGNYELLFRLLVALMLIIWLKWDLKLLIYRGLSLKNEPALANGKFENTMGNPFFLLF